MERVVKTPMQKTLIKNNHVPLCLPWGSWVLCFPEVGSQGLHLLVQFFLVSETNSVPTYRLLTEFQVIILESSG